MFACVYRGTNRGYQMAVTCEFRFSPVGVCINFGAVLLSMGRFFRVRGSMGACEAGTTLNYHNESNGVPNGFLAEPFARRFCEHFGRYFSVFFDLRTK